MASHNAELEAVEADSLVGNYVLYLFSEVSAVNRIAIPQQVAWEWVKRVRQEPPGCPVVSRMRNWQRSTIVLRRFRIFSKGTIPNVVTSAIHDRMLRPRKLRSHIRSSPEGAVLIARAVAKLNDTACEKSSCAEGISSARSRRKLNVSQFHALALIIASFTEKYVTRPHIARNTKPPVTINAG